MNRATKTLKAIDEAMLLDGGAAFRQLSKKYLPLMDDAYRGQEQPFRRHLGVSGIGRECSRELWYTFRWASKAVFEPRILRLFNRGHLEEARFLAMLEMIGVQIWSGPADGGQFKLQGVGGHFGSALDGIALGVPDRPETPCLLEFKTSSDKEFKKVISNGVEKAKWVHYVQMQVCMAAYDLPAALYLVVNKNDDDLHAELVDYAPDIAARYYARAAEIILTADPPRKISDTPSWFQCKMCDHAKVCHYGMKAERNCRTCLNSEAISDGCWMCRHLGQSIDTDGQRLACPAYVYDEKFNFPV